MKSPLGKTKGCLGLAALTLCAMLAGGCIQPNSYPIINSLEAEKERVPPSGSCEVECIASDADGDSLTYTWSATGGTVSGQGPVAMWVAPNMPGTSTVTVRVTDGRGGEVIGQLTLDVIKVNHPPVIESLIAEPPEVREADTSAIRCIATDPDGDELNYRWEATGGNFSGQGSTVDWTAPSTSGSYFITVKVTDGSGGETTSRLTVDVLVNHPPVIESLTAEPSPVRQSETSTVECVASDPDGDELNYLWSADRGNISGQGSIVDWTAPNSCGNYIVTLTVADGRGGEVSRELEIRVKKPG